MSGFFYSFTPLSKSSNDGLQHISARTLDQYYYIAQKNGLMINKVTVDKYQKTSKCMIWLWPTLYGFTKLKRIDFKIHNQIKLLLGRNMFISFEKEVSSSQVKTHKT
jgi:hypothetical protein